MPQHVRHEKEVHFFAITQSYIRMTSQDLVKPRRAAPEGTDPKKGWQARMCKVALPRLIVWPNRQCSPFLREWCVPRFQSLFGPGKFSAKNPAHFVCSVIVLMLGGQGKDSNLRCDLGRIATLASCCLKPLSHLSSNSYFTSACRLRQCPRSNGSGMSAICPLFYLV